MDTDTHRAIARDPLVRTAGHALLATSTAAAAFVLLLTPMFPIGTRTSPGALAAVLLTPAVLLAACAVGVLRGRRWPVVPAVVGLTLIAAGIVLVLPLCAVLVALLVAAFLRGGRLGRAPAGSRPVSERPPGWSRDPAVVVAAASCLLVSAGATVWVGLEAPRHTGTFAAEVGLATAMAIALVPALGVAAGAVGLLRGSPAWALGTAAQLAAYAGEVVAMGATRGTSLQYWVLVDGVLLVFVAIAYRRLSTGQPDPVLPPARTGDAAGM